MRLYGAKERFEMSKPENDPYYEQDMAAIEAEIASQGCVQGVQVG